MPSGKLITLEGIEGAGKTTQTDAVRRYLEAHGLAVLVTREPGGTQLSENIRALLLDRSHPAMTPMTELLLIYAARNEHCAQVIFPALAAGTWVLCDRFHDASYAYQGGGRGIPLDQIALLENLISNGRAPDLTLLFDAPVALLLARAAARKGEADRFEAERAEFFERARACYLDRAKADPTRFRVIDATPSFEVVAAAVNAALRSLIIE